MGAAAGEVFLTNLAVDRNVSASTQNQALFAVSFLYKEVLRTDLPWLNDFTAAKKESRVPVVLTKDEVKPNNRFGVGSPAVCGIIADM